MYILEECISIKNLGGIWVGIVLNLYICLGNIDDVTLLSLPIPEEPIYLV